MIDCRKRILKERALLANVATPAVVSIPIFSAHLQPVRSFYHLGSAQKREEEVGAAVQLGV